LLTLLATAQLTSLLALDAPSEKILSDHIQVCLPNGFDLVSANFEYIPADQPVKIRFRAKVKAGLDLYSQTNMQPPTDNTYSLESGVAKPGGFTYLRLTTKEGAVHQVTGEFAFARKAAGWELNVWNSEVATARYGRPLDNIANLPAEGDAEFKAIKARYDAQLETWNDAARHQRSNRVINGFTKFIQVGTKVAASSTGFGQIANLLGGAGDAVQVVAVAAPATSSAAPAPISFAPQYAAPAPLTYSANSGLAGQSRTVVEPGTAVASAAPSSVPTMATPSVAPTMKPAQVPLAAVHAVPAATPITEGKPMLANVRPVAAKVSGGTAAGTGYAVAKAATIPSISHGSLQVADNR
ncbi:MAG TPA: hypothetical protein VMB21_02820, partial [Candidatus Limnocylindria bacterium]|nr:hypothetical protein [Candidatus Limnocylindria bacterium]